jgi:hypothetical protein
MQMYCTFVLFVNQHFPGLPASGTHCIMFYFSTLLAEIQAILMLDITSEFCVTATSGIVNTQKIV